MLLLAPYISSVYDTGVCSGFIAQFVFVLQNGGGRDDDEGC
jgi:hypothetical protein